MADYEKILLKVEDGVATITLNRPKEWNALCRELNREMEEALRTVAGSPDVRVLIITGNEKFFAAGADVREMMSADPFAARRTSAEGGRINEMIESLPIPVIAAVCGPALGGGCELALACDFRVLGDNAKLGLPEAGLGILPGAGGTQRLTRLIGAGKAKELILLGRTLNAQQAKELGLATEVVPAAEAMSKARELAAELIEKPYSALLLAKQAVRYGENFGPGAGREFENLLFSLAFSDPDQAEGMLAFVERRKPDYSNRLQRA